MPWHFAQAFVPHKAGLAGAKPRRPAYMKLRVCSEASRSACPRSKPSRSSLENRPSAMSRMSCCTRAGPPARGSGGGGPAGGRRGGGEGKRGGLGGGRIIKKKKRKYR